MRSRHADRFNHDEGAAGYDLDVRDESDPIRAGYETVLDWVATSAPADGRILDLGAGTGNLSLRLRGELWCVDVSAEMEKIARSKLADREDVRFVRSDLLEFFDAPGPDFDAIVSTYAIHHLVEDEKQQLFARIAARLRQGGRAAFGDLMFESADVRGELLDDYRKTGRGELADDVEDEFFWDVSTAVAGLEALGLEVETRRFSELGWGIRGTAP
jgi:putative AdoMet-dependent methyltransferase